MYYMLTMANDLSAWLNEQTEVRGWSFGELHRRSGMSVTQISDVVNGKRRPGLDFCVNIARALGELPEVVLRHAGLLPAIPEATEREREIQALVLEQPEDVQRLLVAMLRGLARKPARGGEDPWWRAIREELEPLTEEQREWALAAVREMKRLEEQPAMHVIGAETEHEEALPEA